MGEISTMKFYKNDEGVSAIIGVILVVAITLILAAVVASYVFHLGGNVQKAKTVGVDVRRTTVTGVIAVVTMGGSDVGSMKSGGADYTNSAEATYTLVADGKTIPPCDSSGDPLDDGSDNFNANSIGSLMYFGAASGTDMIRANAQISVAAHFDDSSDTAVWTGNLP